jgi:aromatic ring hydroxylase
VRTEQANCATTLAQTTNVLSGRTTERDACMTSLATANAEVARLNSVVAQLNAQLAAKQKILSCLKSKCSGTYRRCGGR